jgi:hypothetical protein
MCLIQIIKHQPKSRPTPLSEGVRSITQTHSQPRSDLRTRLIHTHMFLIMHHLSLRPQSSLARLTGPNIPKRRRRNPGPTPARHLDLRIQLIDLFQGQAFCLIDHKIHKRDTQKTTGEPDKKDFGLEICVSVAEIHEIRCGVGDRPVKEPICGGRHGETFSADFEGKDLACDDPGDGSPGRREEEDVDADEGDGGALGGDVQGEGEACDGVLTGVDGAEGCDDELGDTHANGTGEEEGSPAEFVDGVETGDGGSDVYGGCDHADNEGVFDAGIGKVSGAVVKNEINPGKLDQG